MPALADYAGELYARPGMQQLLLELQDEAGQDVLLLLTACWLGQRGVLADSRLWRDLHASQQPWREQVIQPLRQVRRSLAEQSATADLYQQVKACELAAEWHQLQVLEQLCAGADSAVCKPLQATAEHLALCCGDPSDSRLQQLLNGQEAQLRADGGQSPPGD